ncbi:unnamed protein product [Protopolystoma xenopodis]|uniref:Uncharacterized protein n=1 Tax=Protopolystoma xenopodis TaxID=117903 RepID=A0A448XB64_9PLAT|nr:unnamed protein product [Protopolystoma xenopodis]
MVLSVMILTDDADYDADYDAGETSVNVSRPRSDFGNDHAYNGLQTWCVSLGRPANMTKLRKQSQTIWMQTQKPTDDLKIKRQLDEMEF